MTPNTTGPAPQAPPRPVITTYTGREVNPLNPAPADVNVEDVAHALALCNRFAGHTREPISVAQHSVYVAALVPEQYRLRAMLHDAAEAYLGDVTKWLKSQPEMRGYREAELRVQTLIYRRFGLPADDPTGDEEVRRADRLMVRYEGMRGFGGDWRVSGLQPSLYHRYPDLTSEEVSRVDALFGGWQFWDWRTAKAEFRYTFAALTGSQPCT